MSAQVSSPWPTLLMAALMACAATAADAADPMDSSADRSEKKLVSNPELPLYLPAAAHVSGAAGTDWRSDVEIFNLGPGQAFIEVAMLEKDQANLTPGLAPTSSVPDGPPLSGRRQQDVW